MCTRLLVERIHAAWAFSRYVPYNVSTCPACMQHNGYIKKLYFSTLPSAAYTNVTTSYNLYIYTLCNFKFYDLNYRENGSRLASRAVSICFVCLYQLLAFITFSLK